MFIQEARNIHQGVKALQQMLADEVSREAVAGLLIGEAAPIEVIKWKEIYERMESATDFGEDVANLLEGISPKHC